MYTYNTVQGSHTNLLRLWPKVKSSSEQTQIRSNRDFVFDFRSVCWAKKCSQRAQSGGTTKLHGSTGHFLSAKTVLHNSLSTESEATVPPGPRSRAASHTFIHPTEPATCATIDWEGWSLAWFSWRVRSIWITRFLRDLIQIVGLVRISLVKFEEYGSSRRRHCLTSEMDSTSG